jgi:hypothetical protein
MMTSRCKNSGKPSVAGLTNRLESAARTDEYQVECAQHDRSETMVGSGVNSYDTMLIFDLISVDHYVTGFPSLSNDDLT